MKTLIRDYRNVPGRHCGSVAMQNLLRHYCGLELPEEVVFGLGSGIDCIFLHNPRLTPALVLFGRSITMEVDLAEALAVDYRETMEMDDRKAWEDVRSEVAAGRPVMLSGDVFYLDYREFKVHFPAHRFVLVGFDDERETAFVADRLDPEAQACSCAAVARSRNPPVGLSTFNLWGRFHDTKVGNSLEDACARALRKTAARMLGQDSSQTDLLRAFTAGPGMVLDAGLRGLERFASGLREWHAREDAGSLAGYASQAIEKFGTGGGNFRRMYAVFLGWANRVRPDLVPATFPALAEESAAGWSGLAQVLDRASQSPGDRPLWTEAARQAGEILRIESELFTALGQRTLRP